MMDKLKYYKIKLNHDFHMKEILRLHQAALKCKSKIYLSQSDMIADAKDLPKLLSFFLASNEETFTMINKGATAPEEQNLISNLVMNKATLIK